MRPAVQRTAEGVLLLVGIVIGVACTDSNAQGAAQIRAAVGGSRDDTAAVSKLLAVVRGADPVVCELTVRAADMHGSWSSWGPISGDPLVMDSSAAALLNWVQRRHTDPSVVPALRAGMQSDDRCVRRLASSLLSRVRHPSVAGVFESALGDRNAGTREAAAFGLGMLEAPSATDPLIEHLHDDSPAVRRAAAWALGQMESKQAMPGLVNLLARDSDPRVRQTAAWAMGNIHQQ
jgi:HEAT repeat protein